MPLSADFRRACIKRIKAKVSAAGLDAILVTGGSDLFYILGYTAGGAKLLVPKAGKAVFFIDGMNESLARKYLSEIGVLEIFCPGRDKSLAACCGSLKVRKLGVNPEHLSASGYKALKGTLRNIRVVEAGSILGEMRKIKGDAEIELLRKASREAVKIWRSLKREAAPGMREKDIARMIDVLIRERGYENSFPTIAAIGENSAYPHAVPAGRRLRTGDHFLVDFGLRVERYCSDLTRTWYKGRIDRQIGDFRKIVLKAQEMAIKMIKPGVGIGTLLDAVNSYFNTNNMGAYVLHGLGHGIGVDIHEGPLMRKGSTERLKKGMVITIEPGLYKEGLGGIREEDMVLVTSKGCEVLTV
jgi:Xaa-Pro aminopeptidase